MTSWYVVKWIEANYPGNEEKEKLVKMLQLEKKI